jgi:hypothetical protein
MYHRLKELLKRDRLIVQEVLFLAWKDKASEAAANHLSSFWQNVIYTLVSVFYTVHSVAIDLFTG